ncbi:hypothetical protein [Pseudomonas citronellolis]|uniref:hypothetical protein n=1 Tax=Pseudomonas citronellolis TaxID=53408 RepID=UPI0023E40B86|nr:hypothetical protein [Pseudomonas citronellolis]MDF3932939.1 hypothetical protein [Pseudomonas citronellolis]
MAKAPRAPRASKENTPAKSVESAAASQVGATEQSQSQLVEGQLAGVQLQDGTVVPLAELPEADLRKMATDLEIDGADSLPIEQLVAAIQAEKVLVDEGDDLADIGDGDGSSSSPSAVTSDAPPHLAGEDGRYQVLLTDGSLAYLEELSTEDLVELAAACLHLAPPGLGGAQFIGMDLTRAELAMEAIQRGTADTSRYIVRRERLDHNDESYALGDLIQFDDDEHARQLLAIGAIAPEVV